MHHKTGLLLATVIGLGCGLLARPTLTPTAAQAQARSNPGNQSGRYQVAVGDGTLLFCDTATGRMWRTAAQPSPGELQWFPISSPVSKAR